MSDVSVRKIIHRAGGAFCASVEQRAGLLPLPQGVRLPGVTLSNLSPAGLAAGPAAHAPPVAVAQSTASRYGLRQTANSQPRGFFSDLGSLYWCDSG